MFFKYLSSELCKLWQRTGRMYLNEPPYSAHNRCELSVGNRLSWYFSYLVLSNWKTGCVIDIFFFLQHSFLPLPILKHRPNSQSNVKQHPEQPYLDTSQGHDLNDTESWELWRQGIHWWQGMKLTFVTMLMEDTLNDEISQSHSFTPDNYTNKQF